MDQALGAMRSCWGRPMCVYSFTDALRTLLQEETSGMMLSPTAGTHTEAISEVPAAGLSNWRTFQWILLLIPALPTPPQPPL